MLHWREFSKTATNHERRRFPRDSTERQATGLPVHGGDRRVGRHLPLRRHGGSRSARPNDRRSGCGGYGCASAPATTAADAPAARANTPAPEASSESAATTSTTPAQSAGVSPPAGQTPPTPAEDDDYYNTLVKRPEGHEGRRRENSPARSSGEDAGAIPGKEFVDPAAAACAGCRAAITPRRPRAMPFSSSRCASGARPTRSSSDWCRRATRPTSSCRSRASRPCTGSRWGASRAVATRTGLPPLAPGRAVQAVGHALARASTAVAPACSP